MIRLRVPAVHRNPKYWPHSPPRNTFKPAFAHDNLDNDLEEFKPERWILHSENNPGGPLYTPVKGSYIPFSDGQRSCLGKRFAQLKIMAALAVVLSEYTVELAADEWASDEEVASMNVREREVVWRKAEEKGHATLQNKMFAMMTLQLRGAHVPVSFVKKGEEKFGSF